MKTFAAVQHSSGSTTIIDSNLGSQPFTFDKNLVWFFNLKITNTDTGPDHRQADGPQKRILIGWVDTIFCFVSSCRPTSLELSQKILQFFHVCNFEFPLARGLVSLHFLILQWRKHFELL